MKNQILLVFVLLAFGACKNDQEPKPDKIYEKWEILSNSTIRYGYRDIVSTIFRENTLHINAKNSYYALDSNLKLINENGTGTHSYWNQQYSPKYSNEYGIMIDVYDAFNVFDISQPGLDQISFRFSKEGVKTGTLQWEYSKIDETRRFSIVTCSREGDSVVFHLHNYFIDHTPGAFKPITLIKEHEVKLFSYMQKAEPSCHLSINRLAGKTIVNIDGKLLTFNGKTLESESRYSTNNSFESEGDIYAASRSMMYFADEHQTSDGLLVSSDKGANWSYYGYGGTYTSANYKVMNGLKFMYHTSFIALLDDESREMVKINIEGLDAEIHSIEKVGNNVIVGTDAGVYYKSWESFVNK